MLLGLLHLLAIFGRGLLESSSRFPPRLQMTWLSHGSSLSLSLPRYPLPSWAPSTGRVWSAYLTTFPLASHPRIAPDAGSGWGRARRMARSGWLPTLDSRRLHVAQHLLQTPGGQCLYRHGGRSWQMRQRSWRLIRDLPALSEWALNGSCVPGRPVAP